MKSTRSPRDAVLSALAVGVACVWLSGCGGLTPLAEGTDETKTGRPVPEQTAPTPVDGGADSDDGGSDSSDGANDGGSDGDDGDDTETVVYTWSLPPDPETPVYSDDSAYGSLYLGNCEAAADIIPDATDESPGSWSGPRGILFTAAGVAFCRGDVETGRALTQQAIDEYGVDGLGPEDMLWCKLYRELRSVIEQRPEDAFQCLGNYWEGPKFKTRLDANGAIIAWDDPLTREDETLQPPASGPPPASETEEPDPEAPSTPSEGDPREG